MSPARKSGSPGDGPDPVQIFRAQSARQIVDLDTEPMEILGRAYRNALLTRRAIEATFARFQLDSGEFDVIGTLLRAGPPHRLTPTELYTSLMLSSGGLTHRLIRLERAGLITRAPSPVDGRSLLVELTRKGKNVAEKALRAGMAVEQQILEGLSPEARRRISSALRELGDVIRVNVERIPAARSTRAQRRSRRDPSSR
jgi:DNA-binding MarR family transcriptional regulator